MSSLLVDIVSPESRATGVAIAIRMALAAFDPQPINLETIQFEMSATMSDATEKEICEELGEMQRVQTVVMVCEEMGYFDEAELYKTIDVIAFKLNRTWNENS